MGYEVNSFDAGACRDGANELAQVPDGELAGFAVIGIAAYAAQTCRPGIGDGDTDAAHEVPDLRGAKDRIVECVVETVHENVDVLVRLVGQPGAQKLVERFDFSPIQLGTRLDDRLTWPGLHDLLDRRLNAPVFADAGEL